MMTVVVFEEDALRLIMLIYVCSVKWKKFGRKQSFYDELKGEWDMHSAGDLVMRLGDLIGNIGRHMIDLIGFMDVMG